MQHHILKNALLVAGLGMMCQTLQAQSTFSISNVPVPAEDEFNFSAPGTTLGPAGTDYYVGNTIGITSGNITVIGVGDFESQATEARLELYNSQFPGLTLVTGAMWQDEIDFTSGPTDTILSSTEAFGSLIGAFVPASSVWSYNAFDEFPDSATGDDAIFNSLTFTIDAGDGPLPAVDSLTFSGPSIDAEGDPSNTIIIFPPQTAPDYVLGSYQFTGGSANLVGFSRGNEISIRLRNSAYPFRSVLIRPFTHTGESTVFPALTPTVISPLTNASPQANFVQPLAGMVIPTGSVWRAEIFESAQNSNNIAEATISNLSMNLIEGFPYTPETGTPPEIVNDLGNLDSASAPVATPLTVTPALAGENVFWYKFTTATDILYNGTSFLDFYVTPASGATGANDLEMALYSADGVFLGTDDDDGQANLPQMSFGLGGGTRAASPAIPGVVAAGAAFTGSDNSGALQAGTYYLAVTRYNTTFNNAFGLGLPTSTITLPFTLNVRTNLSNAISGSVNLLNTAVSSVTELIDWTLTNGTNTYSGTLNLSSTGGTYSIPLPSGATPGAYTLRFKGGTFLSETLNLTLNGSGIANQNVSLKNGDIDQDGEVGPSDFEAVVAQFGGPGDADADNDEEVGPSDFEIIVANFGLGDN